MTCSRCLAFWCVAVLPAVLSPASAEEVATEAKPAFDFERPTVSFRADFAGARLSDCTRVAEAEYEARILPENTPINNSAWYAFQVTSDAPCTITVRLTYEGGTHRYHPKISHDGLRWTPLGPEAYARDKAKGEATLRLDVGPEPLWVAAQELMRLLVAKVDSTKDRAARRGRLPPRGFPRSGTGTCTKVGFSRLTVCHQL